MANETKKSFILYHDYYEIIKKLPKEQVGDLLSAIFEYEMTGKVPKLDFATELVFISIRQDLDRNAEKYADVIEKRREAGAKGGKQRAKNIVEKISNEANQANAKFAKNFEANQADNDNVNVNVNVNDNVNVNENVNVNDNSLSSLSMERGGGKYEDRGKCNETSAGSSVSKYEDKGKYEEKTEELTENCTEIEEREILEKYLSKTKPNIRNPKAYITKLIKNGDYADILKEARAYELKTEYIRELKEKNRLEEEKKRLEEEEKKLQKEKELAERKAEQTRLYNELCSPKIIERKMQKITDKYSAAYVLAEYYEQCGLPPPPEFDEITAKYELETHEKIEDYLKEVAMNRCREIVMRATKRL